MKVQYGTVITGASGSLGGIVAARNANGAYLRRKVKNVNPNTIPQQNRRNQFGSLSRQWKLLSASQQNGWSIASPAFPYKNKLNIASTYTGFQLFAKVNNQLLSIGQTMITDAPTPTVVDGLSLNTAAIVIATPSAILSGTNTTTGDSTIPTGNTVVVWATGSLSSGISKPKNPQFRKIATFPDSWDLSSMDVTDTYLAVFGAMPAPTANCYFQLQFVNNFTGQVGKRVTLLASIA
jgi:hypothetical protein